MPDVVNLGAHARMTTEQVLALASREEWESVMIVGYHKDSPELVVRSSSMSREQALWLAEHLRLHSLGRL